ncbi:MAG TPA: protein phosphatase 2C domain-containing protein [Propionicimonas sp.]|jgi:protein phosphatase|uniref:PP2C family protein-serine/threonine phosphatase n=1 Tax=Propionicimonas sp. TaxID=1955623 RepID=UPI002F42C18F
MTLALRYVAHSEIGLVRKNNQDSAYVSPTMLMVADGMGGAAAGDLASAVAIRELKAADGSFTGEEMLDVVGEAIDRAGAVISELVDADPSLDGMGSTVCGAMFDGTQLGVANIGDSRAYLYRDGILSRLTRDHSWVQTLVDEGRITEAEALEHPHRSLILKVINGQPHHQPDLKLVDVRPGDRLLICSDGLCGMVTDNVIAAELDGERDAVLAALIRLAHHEGGQDNITIILADVVEGEAEGVTDVLGAAADLDLDNPTETTARQAVVAADTAPRPDPGAGELVRYSPVARRRASTWVKVVLGVFIPLLAIGGAGTLWYSYTQGQYYLGAHETTLAIFQGVPEPVFNLPLSHVVEQDATRVVDLPPYYQERVLETMPAESLDAARSTLATLKLKAAECIRQRTMPQSTPTPTPSPTVSSSPTKAPTGSASPSANLTASPTPTPTPTPSDTSTPAAPMEC